MYFQGICFGVVVHQLKVYKVREKQVPLKSSNLDMNINRHLKYICIHLCNVQVRCRRFTDVQITRTCSVHGADQESLSVEVPGLVDEASCKSGKKLLLVFVLMGRSRECFQNLSCWPVEACRSWRNGRLQSVSASRGMVSGLTLCLSNQE